MPDEKSTSETLELIRGQLLGDTKKYSSKKAEELHLLADDYIKSVVKDGIYGRGKGHLKAGVANDQLINDLFYLVDEDQRVAVVSEPEIVSDMYLKNHGLSTKDYQEVVKLVRIKLTSTALDLAKVAAVVLADETKLHWFKLPFTEVEARAISLDTLPEFADFLRRAGEGAGSLTLFLGSLLDPESGRTQYLHIHGEGGDGKSALIDSISRVFGNDRVVSIDDDLFSNTHFGEQLEGARLLVFSDENNPHFVSGGKFKRYTGDPYASINPKGRKPRFIHFTHKTIVTSNNESMITAGNADRRRIIPVKMERDTSGGGRDVKWWYKGLVESGEKILAYCFGRYLDAIEAEPTTRNYIEPSMQLIAEAEHRKYETIIDTINEEYEVTGVETDKVKCSDLHKTVAREMGQKRHSMFLSQVREGIGLLGVKIVMVNGYKQYVGIKTRAQASVDRVNEKRIK